MNRAPSIHTIRTLRREAETRAAFERFEKRREIALATIRNIARSAEELAAEAPAGSADRVALHEYADSLWRAHTHALKAANTPLVFTLTTSILPHETSAA